jgi:CCR4-NOT transcription complex subunit 3
LGKGVQRRATKSKRKKYEMDLKKEIKKLQRSNQNVDWFERCARQGTILLEARKRLIETKIEQFKICEKETKTKTYSKESLARAETLYPLEEAKLATMTWIADIIE